MKMSNLDFNHNNVGFRTEKKENTKKKINKKFSNNINDHFGCMTQARFYRSKLNKDELTSDYAKNKIKSINSTRNSSFNLNNGNIDIINKKFNKHKILHSFSNSDSTLQNNKTFNQNLDSNKNNNIELYNKIYNDILYSNHLLKNYGNNNYNYYNKNSQNLNNIRKDKILKHNISNNSNNNDSNIIDFLKNYNYDNIKNNLFENKSYRFSSPLIGNSLSPLNNFNFNNNMNDNICYLCDKCLERKLLNESNINMIHLNNISNHIIKLCPNCQYLFI